LYLPSIAFAGCLAWAWWHFERRIPAARLALRAIPVILCLVLAARTFARNNDWLDERSLWTSATEVSSNSYKAHQHLASILAAPEVKELDAARSQIERALAILAPLPDDRNVAAVYTTAGFVYRAQGDAAGPDAAAAWYRKSLDILLQGERLDEAFFRAMSQRNLQEGKVVALTGWSPLYLELGRTYRTLGDFQKALESFDHGRLIDPQLQFFEERANTYRTMNQPAQATISLLEGITVGSGDQARLAAEVVNAYRESAPQSCALSPSNALNFDCPLVRQQLCEAGRNVAFMYHRMRRDQEAAATRAGVIQSLGCPAEMFR
jgi:tetratricopeptide (TPR) repeat protein